MDYLDKGVTPELRSETWWRSDDFGIARNLEGDWIIRVPKKSWKKRIPEDEYRPLVDYPRLFLKFARLAEKGGLDDQLDTDKNKEVALQWARDYGVLGLTPPEEGEWRSDPRGGSGDTAARFAFEAWAAHSVLRLFEAYTRSGGADIETIVSLVSTHPKHLVRDHDPVGRARHKAYANVQYRVAKHGSYPQLYVREDGTFVEGYGFASLNAALWQQAFWLLIDEDAPRCQYPKCNRVITFKQPKKPLDHKRGERKKYKTRKDIKYCPEETGRFCRVYHNREKKRR